MKDIIEELVLALKYQQEKLHTLENVCENCMAHLIHEGIDHERINQAIEAGEKVLKEQINPV